MQPITRALLHSLSQLQKRSVRTAEQKFIIEGEKMLLEALTAGWKFELVGYTEKFSLTHGEFLKSFSEFPHYVLSDTEIKRVSTAATPPGVIALLSIPSLPDYRPDPATRLAAFIGINDPGNLGTMIRTADWYGFDAILLSADSVDLYNEKVVRSAMGSLFHLPIYQCDQIKEDLKKVKEQGVTLIAAEAHGSNAQLAVTGSYCIMMGSESHGLPQEISQLADSVYTIPGNGEAESLNVAVSFGIIAHTLHTTK